MSCVSAVAVAIALLAAACGQTTTQEVTGPDVARCAVTLAAPPTVLPPEGGSATLAVTTARDCTWDTASDAAWVQVRPATGQGTGSITVTVARNDDTRPRSTSVSVNEQRVRMEQAGVPCRFDLGTSRLQVRREGARTSISISTTDACEWRASSPAEWVRVVTDRGTGSGSVDLDISRNEGVERSATVTIASLPVVVAQEGSDGAPPSPAPPTGPAPGPPPVNCTYSIDPQSTSFRSSGGEAEIRVQTSNGCPWSASPGADWLSMISPSTGNGPGVIRYRAAANLSTVSARNGSLTVAGHTHAVAQQACGLSLDPASASFASPGGSGSVSIVTDSGCQWSASSSADWISVQSGSGSGPSTLRYTVGVNTSTTLSRSASISVSGRGHAVAQQPYRPEEIALEGIVSSLGGSCPALTFSVGGRTFVSDERTDFRGGCGEVRNGVRVFIRGDVLPDGRVRATLVDADD
jgi:hypothetical protein